MQALLARTTISHRAAAQHVARGLSTTPALPQHVTGSPLPWFVDPSEAVTRAQQSQRRKPAASHKLAPLPSAIPEKSPIARLHAALANSPFLEPGTLSVREPIPTSVGPPLPVTIPKGRRKRGRTYAGEGIPDSDTGLWNWIVIAQVKDGTENRGAIESVLRVVRKTLLDTEPPLPLPHNHKRRVSDGWSMLDAGDFVVHIVSGAARRQYFPDQRQWQAIYARLIFLASQDLIHMCAPLHLTDEHRVLNARCPVFPVPCATRTAINKQSTI